MDRAFWLERWERNQIGFHEDEVNTHLQAFWPAVGLPPGSRVFVPLCGKSRDLLWLRAQGHQVVGVEWSPVAVRDFFAENRLSPRFRIGSAFDDWEADGILLRCGDFFDLVPADLAGVRAVYDRASLIALPRSLRGRYASHLLRLLPAGAPTLLITLEYDEALMGGPPFAVDEAEVRALFGGHRDLAVLHDRDILDGNPRFRERGLDALREKVYLLEPRRGEG